MHTRRVTSPLSHFPPLPLGGGSSSIGPCARWSRVSGGGKPFIPSGRTRTPRPRSGGRRSRRTRSTTGSDCCCRSDRSAGAVEALAAERESVIVLTCPWHARDTPALVDALRRVGVLAAARRPRRRGGRRRCSGRATSFESASRRSRGWSRTTRALDREPRRACGRRHADRPGKGFEFPADWANKGVPAASRSSRRCSRCSRCRSSTCCRRTARRSTGRRSSGHSPESCGKDPSSGSRGMRPAGCASAPGPRRIFVESGPHGQGIEKRRFVDVVVASPVTV